MPQADFALALYREPVLVRFVLAHVKLPDGAERVALALERAGHATPVRGARRRVRHLPGNSLIARLDH